MALCIGEVVRTSYGTGPYKVVRAYGPSTAPSYIDQMRGIKRRSEPHFNLVCHDAVPAPGRKRHAESYLNGYRLDGTSVWCDDFLVFESVSQGANLNLFAAYDFRVRENRLRPWQQSILDKLQAGATLRIEPSSGEFFLYFGKSRRLVTPCLVNFLLESGHIIACPSGEYCVRVL